MAMLFPILVFLSVSLTVIGLAVWFSLSRTRSGCRRWRCRPASRPGPRPPSSSSGRSRSCRRRPATPTCRRCACAFNAGIRHPDAYLIYFGLKTLLPLGFAAVAFLMLRAAGSAGGMTMLLWLALAALAGCYLPNALLYLRIRTRRREIFENFPDAADLMLVCVEAGLGLDAGLAKVTEEIQIKSRALAQELHWTNLEMRAGGTREKSLRNLALRTGVEEIGTFATMLTQADRFGTSIGESLRVFSDDLRHKRQVRAEELAAKVPTKMLLPLVLCIFPCISLVILTPAAIRVIRMIGPMLTGHQ